MAACAAVDGGSSQEATSSNIANIDRSSVYTPLKAVEEENVPQPPGRRMSFRENAGGRYIVEDGPAHGSIALIPPTHFHFDLLFLRMLYHQMEEFGYYNKEHGGVHISMFRRCMRRLLDMFNSEMDYDFEAFGGYRNAVYIKWDDIRVATETSDGLSRLPAVEMGVAERIFMVLEGNANSILGIAWTSIVFVAIIWNVFVISVQSMEEDICLNLINDSRCHFTMNICSVVFSIDYAGRLMCSPWCRHGVFNIDWLIEHVVIDPADAHLPMPTQASPWRRLWFFASVPMHVVDLLSILPFWLNLMAGFSHLSLGFLRSLRLLRLFRVMKFGKFSRTLVVLGDTFRKSAQSIGVLLLYIVMVGLMAGAVIYRFEHDAGNAEEAFDSVPNALWWVVCRMVSMQHSLAGAHGIPMTWVSGLIVACVGMFRGVIFVLPIGQITTAFKDAWAHSQTQDRLKREVARSQDLPMGFEWTEDPCSPTVRVELHHCLPDGSEFDIDAYACLPLPLYLAEPADCYIWVKVHGADMYNNLGCNHPEMYFQVVWAPAADTKIGLPRGNLSLRLIRGKGFPGSEKVSWGCKLSVPVRLHGDGAVEYWKSGPSEGGSPRPGWEHCEQLQFEIEWGDARPKTPAKGPTEQEIFQSRVLELLEEQNKRISALEVELRDARNARLAT